MPAQADAGAADAHNEPATQDAGLEPNDAHVAFDASAIAPAATPVDEDAGEPMHEPVQGAVFARCTTNADCSAGLSCTATQASTSIGTVGYCAAACGFTAATPYGSCPQPESGTVASSCDFSVLCTLGSCEQAACPDSMHCETTTFPTIAGVQTTYSCQYAPAH